MQKSDGNMKGEDETPRLASQLSVKGGVRCLSEVEKAWLAGVIDGEGSIFLSKLSHGSWEYRRGFIYVAALSLSNSNEAFVRKIREIIGKGAVNLVKEDRLDWKDKWMYRGTGLTLRGLLPQLLSHLVIKRELAERMLEYLSFVDANPIDGSRKQIPTGYYERLDSLYLAVKRLNEKGKSTSPRLLEELLSQPTSLNNRGRGERATECRQMNEEEKAWLAGVIDGEGSIFLSKVVHPNYRRGFFYRPQLEVSNCDRFFLVRVMETIGEGTVQLAQKGRQSWKVKWEYGAAAGVLRTVLPQIIPFLIIKKATGEKMLEYFDYIDKKSIRGRKTVPSDYYENLDSIYWRIKNLNEKGKRNIGN